MSSITSKLTSKAQTVIPQAVRKYLGLQPGDELVYELREGAAIIRPKRALREADDPFALFDEWHSEADEKAYADL